VTPPRGSVSVDRAAFNPAGSPGQNAAVFANEGSKEDSWTAEVIDRGGAVVKSWRFVQQPDPKVEWDGSDDQGKPLPDGVYVYRIRSQDRAGNAFTSNSATVALDTERKTARLTVDQRAFSPNGDGSKDSVRISPFVQANDKVKGYELSVVALDVPGVAAGTKVKTWSDAKGLPESFVWDGLDDTGTRSKDGRYAARLVATYQNEDMTEAATAAFTLDTTAPSMQVSAAPLLFSPNADSRRKVLRFTQKSVAGDDWEGRILASDETVVRSFTWKSVAVDFVWDGTDEAGNLVKDGLYRYEASSQDAAGNKGGGSVTGIRVDKRPVQVFVTASDFGLSPNGDGIKDEVTFSLIVNLREGVESWHFALFDTAGKERAVFGSEGGTVPSRIVWDGRDIAGKTVDGEYTGLFTVSYLKGDVAEARSGKVIVDTEGPDVTVSITPELFSPDNDGVGDELTIAMDVKDKVDLAEWRFQILETAVAEGVSTRPAQRVFMTWSGSGAPAKTIVWDGRSAKGELVESATDYPFVFTVRDVLGTSTRVEGFITVDVLVIREGDRLKIKIPTIVFRPNFSDFVGLDKETVDRNYKVIRRIAQILNRFRDYRIGIEGHANSEAKIRGLSAEKIAVEEQNELLPLSMGRAELVRKILAENGVDEKRMTVTGLGSSQPVVDFQDAENRWKNRRVEFILIKNAPAAGGTGG
jgi:flagellar hook assembly protein FlgD